MISPSRLATALPAAAVPSSAGGFRAASLAFPALLMLAAASVLIAPSASAAPASGGAVAQHFEDSVVRLLVSKREWDPSAPWQSEDTKQQAFLAVVLPGGELLTTAYAIADAADLELQRFGSSSRDEAQVAFVDYEANLALLRPVAAAALNGTKPVVLGEDLNLDDSVEIYKVRDAYQLSRIAGRLQEVDLLNAGTSSYSTVAYALKVQQTGLGWAEPVFQGSKFVGLTAGQDQSFLQAIPISLIKHFLADQHNGSYRGFPSLGLQLSPLVSPDQRRLLQVPASVPPENGVRIAAVEVTSPLTGKLQVDDVLLALDGTQVSEHGFISHPSWGKVHLKALLNQHYAGDTVHLSILRHGQPLSVDAVLSRYDSNRAPVVVYRYGEPEPHLIVGGLVFEELSEDYLRQWGHDWRETAPVDLLFALDIRGKHAAAPGTRIIFLTHVLADSFNRGYQDLRHRIVESVNGQEIHSLAGLRQALATPVVAHGQNYERIKLGREGDEIILATAGMPAANARIARTYEINSPQSFYTPAGPQQAKPQP